MQQYPEFEKLNKNNRYNIKENLAKYFGFDNVLNIIPNFRTSHEDLITACDQIEAKQKEAREREERLRAQQAAARAKAEQERKAREQREKIEKITKQLGNETATTVIKNYQAWGNSTSYKKTWNNCSVSLRFDFRNKLIIIDDIDGERRKYKLSCNWKYYDGTYGPGISDAQAHNDDYDYGTCEIRIQKGSRLGSDIWVLSIDDYSAAQESNAYFFEP